MAWVKKHENQTYQQKFKIMKRLFFGLAVAIVALSASAFTSVKPNANRLTTVYITGKTIISGVTYYTFSDTDPGTTCQAQAEPCELETKGSYTVPSAPSPLRFPASDYNTTNFTTQSRQPQFQ